MMRFPALFVALLLLPLTLQGGVYRWVDKNGLVHFGDRPAGAEATEVDVKPQPLNGPSDGPVDHEQMRRRTLQMLQEDRQAREKELEEARQAKRERKAKCNKAKRWLERTQRQVNYYIKKPDGSRHFLSQAERDAETRKARNAVVQWCGKSTLR